MPDLVSKLGGRKAHFFQRWTCTFHTLFPRVSQAGHAIKKCHPQMLPKLCLLYILMVFISKTHEYRFSSYTQMVDTTDACTGDNLPPARSRAKTQHTIIYRHIQPCTAIYIAIYNHIQPYTRQPKTAKTIIYTAICSHIHSHIQPNQPYTAMYSHIQPYTTIYTHIQPYTAE